MCSAKSWREKGGISGAGRGLTMANIMSCCLAYEIFSFVVEFGTISCSDSDIPDVVS